MAMPIRTDIFIESRTFFAYNHLIFRPLHRPAFL